MENVKLTWAEVIGPKFDDDMHPAALQVRGEILHIWVKCEYLRRLMRRRFVGVLLLKETGPLQPQGSSRCLSLVTA